MIKLEKGWTMGLQQTDAIELYKLGKVKKRL